MQKKKLTISEQIENMRDKGITFNYVTENEVRDFLKDHNYYFKLTCCAS